MSDHEHVPGSGSRTRSWTHDERGLVSKGIVIFLCFIVVLGIAGMDTASIVVTRFKVNDLAGQAAFEGAGALNRTRSAQDACAAAIALIATQSETAKVPKEGGCEIGNGEVTITVKDRATTIVVDRVDFLSDLADASATSTSSGPTL
jgi:hypothetical protein